MDGMRVVFQSNVEHPSGEWEELGQCIEGILERLGNLETVKHWHMQDVDGTSHVVVDKIPPDEPVERTWTEAQIRDAVCRWWRRFPDDPRVDGFIQRLREGTL